MKLIEATVIRIYEIMQEHNVTQYKLSKLSGVPQSTINMLIKGKTKKVNLTILNRIMDGLGLEIKDFFASPLFDRENLE